MYGDEPVSRPQSSVRLGWVVKDFLYVVAVVQLASGDREPKTSTPGLGQKHRELKFFHQTLPGDKHDSCL